MPGIDVNVGIELEEGDLQPSTLERLPIEAEAKPFPQGGDDSARDKNEFAHRSPHLVGWYNSDTHATLTWRAGLRRVQLVAGNDVSSELLCHRLDIFRRIDPKEPWVVSQT